MLFGIHFGRALILGIFLAPGAHQGLIASATDGPCMTVLKDIPYARVGGERPLLLDLYLPEDPGPKPLVIFVHGGAWRKGDKDRPRYALELLEDGFAVASIGYRLSGEALFPAQIQDCKAAVRYLRAHSSQYKLDPDHFGVWGPSAGGHLAALVGTSGGVDAWEVGDHLGYSSEVQAVCDWYGPTDFLRMDDRPGRMVHLDPKSPESMLIGADIRLFPDKVAEANPINYVSAEDPPFLIVHGKEDLTVIYEQSVLLHEALSAAGVPSDLILLEQAGHGGPAFEGVVSRVADFFISHLMK